MCQDQNQDQNDEDDVDDDDDGVDGTVGLAIPREEKRALPGNQKGRRKERADTLAKLANWREHRAKFSFCLILFNGMTRSSRHYHFARLRRFSNSKTKTAKIGTTHTVEKKRSLAEVDVDVDVDVDAEKVTVEDVEVEMEVEIFEAEEVGPLSGVGSYLPTSNR